VNKTFLCVVLFFACAGAACTVQGTARAATATTFAQPLAVHLAQDEKPASDTAPQTSQEPPPQERITHYTLPPEREQKARAISKVRFRLYIVNTIYGFLVLLVILWGKLAPKYRDLAERFSSRRFLQALVFAPLLVLTIDVLSLPTGIYENWIQRAYGLSVQGWGSWFWDWTKAEIINVILSVLLIWVLYGVIRKSPQRWWFYFWLVSMPIALAVLFIQPFIIDPMFHKFEPLQQKDPPLTAALEKMVQRAGQNIPPERMFWMGAGEKTTGLNAYVAGFGPSKRIVVWDTTIAKMSTPQIVFVAGHETGHYVLGHIPKLIGFFFFLLFVFCYCAYRLAGWVLARWGLGWGIRNVEDWASLPALLLLLSIMFTIASPVANNFVRYQEHQADQYALEVTHGLTPNSGQVGAQAFNILGDVNLADPEPSRTLIFLLYNHPAIPERIEFALTYDPWSKGQRPEFVNRHRGDGCPSSPATPPYMRVRIRRFSELSPRGPEVRVVVRHKGFAALQVSVSASPSSEPVKLNRS
jgi:Zn-dependent protease with chaperone function